MDTPEQMRRESAEGARHTEATRIAKMREARQAAETTRLEAQALRDSILDTCLSENRQAIGAAITAATEDGEQQASITPIGVGPEFDYQGTYDRYRDTNWVEYVEAAKEAAALQIADEYRVAGYSARLACYETRTEYRTSEHKTHRELRLEVSWDPRGGIRPHFQGFNVESQEEDIVVLVKRVQPEPPKTYPIEPTWG